MQVISCHDGNCLLHSLLLAMSYNNEDCLAPVNPFSMSCGDNGNVTIHTGLFKRGFMYIFDMDSPRALLNCTWHRMHS